jgi:hypothetical protein
MGVRITSLATTSLTVPSTPLLIAFDQFFEQLQHRLDHAHMWRNLRPNPLVSVHPAKTAWDYSPL